MKRRNVVTVVGLCLITAALTAAVTLVAAGQLHVGSRDVDLAGYCQQVYGSIGGKVVTVGKNAYSWRCQVTINAQTANLNLNMNQVCRWQYEDNALTAYLMNGNSSSLYTWRCH